MNSPNAALLTRARREHLDLGYVTVETRADLWSVGVSSLDLEGYLAIQRRTDSLTSGV